MLRICLIVAIVAGLGTAALSFLQVKKVMDQTMTERNDEKSAKEKEIAAHNKTKKQLADTQKELKSTKEELASTKTELKTATAKVAEQEKNIANLTTQLNNTRGERDVAQQKLEQWRILDIQPEGVRKLQADLKSTIAARNAIAAENKILNENLRDTKNELAQYKDPNAIVHLPPGLTGHVMAVDPKFDFVVLDIGKDKALLQGGELLVNRSGRLVAKLKVSEVRDNRAIANIMPGWQQGQVMEGDMVLSYQ
jgi:predicted RNase H-like nuclease (RuvC/YqgF family)